MGFEHEAVALDSLHSAHAHVDLLQVGLRGGRPKRLPLCLVDALDLVNLVEVERVVIGVERAPGRAGRVGDCVVPAAVGVAGGSVSHGLHSLSRSAGLGLEPTSVFAHRVGSLGSPDNLPLFARRTAARARVAAQRSTFGTAKMPGEPMRVQPSRARGQATEDSAG